MRHRRSLLAKAWTERREGRSVDPDAGDERFEDFARRWLAGRADLRPRTRELYTHLVERYLVPAFGRQQLRAITSTKVRVWQAGLRK